MTERFLILASAGFALLFAVAGVLIGVALNSSIILFDGLYSFISLGLSLLSLLALKASAVTGNEKFPFGLSMVQPITLFFKYATISLLCIVSINEGIQIILSGGREVNYLFALVYSAIAAFMCFAIYLLLSKSPAAANSDLLRSENHEWIMDTGLSGALAIGFLLALVLNSYSTVAAGYIEPIMLITAALYFLKIPVLGVTRSIKEIIGYKFTGRVDKEIRTYLDQIQEKYNFDHYFLRLQKVGSTVYIEIDFVVPTTVDLSIEEQDALRANIYSMIQQYPYQWWYTLSFTHDMKWAR